MLNYIEINLIFIRLNICYAFQQSVTIVVPGNI